LQELTKLCQKVTGNTTQISSVKENRPADLISFVTDSRRFKQKSGLDWQKGPEETVRDIYEWIKANESALKSIIG
jgi:CDP-paratose 2-epimerase